MERLLAYSQHPSKFTVVGMDGIVCERDRGREVKIGKERGGEESGN